MKNIEQTPNDFMIDAQIIRRGITNKQVIAAMRSIDRGSFVLPEYQADAYIDAPLPTKEHQTISQPYIVAFMTQWLSLNPSDTVLEIGTGSGYQTAILARIVSHVYSIEYFRTLCDYAQRNFNTCGCTNITIKQGNGYSGWSDYAPFQAIIFTCALSEIPPPLLNQLDFGGRCIAPIERYRGFQQLTLIRKESPHGHIIEKPLLNVQFVPFIYD